MRKRVEYWDNLKFILITMVVLTHFLPRVTTFWKCVYDYIFLFHMPLFIFVSGVFYKKERIRERVISFTFIGIVYNILLYFWDVVLLGNESDFFIFGATKIPWFAYCIAICTLVSYVLRDCNKWLVLLMGFMVGCFVGYDTHVTKYLLLSNTISYFPLFWLGTMINKEEFCVRLSKIRCRKLLGGGYLWQLLL